MNKKKDIPNSWKWVTLDDVSITSSGGTPNRKNASNFRGDIPWVKSGELKYDIITETEEYITREALEFSSAKIFPKGSLLIALYGNTVGKMAFLGVDASTNQAVASITPFLINPKYLYYYLMSSKEELLSKREGSAQPNISQKVLNNFLFPLAPIEEQNRIVEKIEELFSEIDKSIDNLQVVKAKIRSNIYSLYNQVLIKNNLGNEIFIRDICPINYGKSLIKKERKIGKIPVYGSNGIIGYHNETYIKKSVIIIGRKGSVGELRFSKEKCYPIDTTYYIEENDSFELKYLFYQLQIKELSQLSKSTTIPGLNREHIYDLKVKMPSNIEEQKLIVEYVDEKLNDIEMLSINISENIDKAKTVYLKILQDAFQGKLSEQLKSDSSCEQMLAEIVSYKESYLKKQQEIIKNRPKIKRMEKAKLSIIQVLEKHKKPISSNQLWEDSMYNDDIEKFYSELKKVQNEIKQEKAEKGTLISLK